MLSLCTVTWSLHPTVLSTHFFHTHVKYGLNVTKFYQQLFPSQPLHALYIAEERFRKTSVRVRLFQPAFYQSYGFRWMLPINDMEEDYKDRRGCINVKKSGSKVVLHACNLPQVKKGVVQTMTLLNTSVLQQNDFNQSFTDSEIVVSLFYNMALI